MKITILMEDTCSADENIVAEHGLSVYVETEKHKILVDTGQTDKTWQNAAALGIDITGVDTVVISHGHYDHSGGLLGFVKQNKTADIYIKKNALLSYYRDEKYIGVDPEIKNIEKIHLLDSNSLVIDDELSLFSDIKGRRFWPKSNLALSERVNGVNVRDEFLHEQCLRINSENKTVLISGCAHNGILNILERYFEIYGNYPDAVISGFHMVKKTPYDKEEITNIEDTARELSKLNTVFYTGHCTGQPAIDIMKDIMGDKIVQIHSGMEL